MNDYSKYITINPERRGGQPCIRDLRITVHDIISYLAAGMTVTEILMDFPQLTRNDVLAALAYCADLLKK